MNSVSGTGQKVGEQLKERGLNGHMIDNWRMTERLIAKHIGPHLVLLISHSLAQTPNAMSIRGPGRILIMTRVTCTALSLSPY